LYVGLKSDGEFAVPFRLVVVGDVALDVLDLATTILAIWIEFGDIFERVVDVALAQVILVESAGVCEFVFHEDVVPLAGQVRLKS
jgi:hypothetical protein